jgi:putative aldouronate transport system substrate-binding protein
MKKLLTVIVAICMIATLFAACTKPAEKETTSTTAKATQTVPTTTEDPKTAYLNPNGAFESEEVVVPVTNEKISLKFAIAQPNNGGPPENYWFWKWLEKFGNIKAEVESIPSNALSETKHLMFASDQLPDVFFMMGFSTSEIMSYGMKEKQLIPMNELLEKYAPNFKAVSSMYPKLIASIKFPDGNIYALPNIREGASYADRVFINNKWIEEAGLKEPETLDDLYNVLKAFKARGEDIIPFGGAWNYKYSESTYVLNALGMNCRYFYDLDEKDGKVYTPMYDSRYLEYLKFFNKLWSEELMDPDIFTQNENQQKAKALTGIYGMTNGGSTLIYFKDNWADYEALRPMTSTLNDTKMISDLPKITNINRFMITKECKYPEAAIRFADMFFTKQAGYLFWMGPIEGFVPDEWAIDPERYLTKFTQNDSGAWVTTWDKLKETGLTNWQYICTYQNPLSGQKLGPAFDPVYTYAKQGLNYSDAISMENPGAQWKASMDEKVVPYYKEVFPTLILGLEEQERVSELYDVFSDYVIEMNIKFITGEESLNNFDNYMKQLKDFGIEEYLKIYQDAYDTFLKSIK